MEGRAFTQKCRRDRLIDASLSPDPARDVCTGKSQAELESLCDLLAVKQWKTDPHPKAIMKSS
jgi:hypothetical protein